MSLAKILAARKRKRNFYGGGDADPEGNADASRPDGSPSVGGFNGGPEPGQAPGTVNPDAFTPPGGSGPEPGQAPGTVNNAAFTPPGPDPFAGLTVESVLGVLGMMPGGLGVLSGLASKGIAAAKQDWSARATDSARFGIPMPSRGQDTGEGGMGTGLGADAAANPFGSSTPTQTTPATPTDAGMRRYVWDPVARQYTLTNVGGGANPMGYTAGQTFRMAAGGAAPAGLAAARTQPRFVQGGGTGLSDDVPVRMDDGGEGRLADGEFVIPADVVSGLGGGSSKAGADMLYQMMERIRQAAHGKSQQIRPVDPSRVLPV